MSVKAKHSALLSAFIFFTAFIFAAFSGCTRQNAAYEATTTILPDVILPWNFTDAEGNSMGSTQDGAQRTHLPTYAMHTLHFSHVAGFFAEPFYLEISAIFNHQAQTNFTPDTPTLPANPATIYFTLDGSLPTLDNAYEYTAPLLIEDRTPAPNVLSAIPGERIGCFLMYPDDYFTTPAGLVFKGTTIRAQAFADGAPVSEVVTKTFFVCEEIFTRYAGLPVISLVTEADNFFCDEIGIYVRGHNNTGGHQLGDPMPNWEQRGHDWERPIHFEFFEPCGTRYVAQNMGVRIHGGGTRRLAQKSFRLYPRAIYDPLNPTIQHDIFNGASTDFFGEPIVEFHRLLLRNFGNEGSGTMIRDTGQQYLAQNMNVDVQAQRYAVVFLNGEFWGLYDIKERHCERFLASHYRANPAYFTMLIMVSSHSRAAIDAGSEADLHDFLQLENFLRENSMECDILFAQAEARMNMESFIDHFILNIYLGNIDWPNQNARVWRYNGLPCDTIPVLDGRWNWMVHDLDSTSGFHFGFRYHDDTLSRLLLMPHAREHITRDERLRPTGTLMFRRLMENAGFRERFFVRFEYVMDNYLSEETFLAMVDTFYEKIAPVVPEQIHRYGRVDSMEHWHIELDTLRTFASNRPAHMRGFIEQLYFTPYFFDANREYIKVLVNSTPLELTVQPVLRGGTVMFPLAEFSAFNISPTFNPTTEVVEIPISNNTVARHRATLIGDEMFVPLQFITDALDYGLEWQVSTYTAVVTR